MCDVSQESIIKYCLNWFNNKFLQESIWVGVVKLKFCLPVTPPLLLDFVYPTNQITNFLNMVIYPYAQK